jgi:hypothetical protein
MAPILTLRAELTARTSVIAITTGVVPNEVEDVETLQIPIGEE